MSWFYPLQKLLGHEVGPEDKTDEALAFEEFNKTKKELDKREERTKDMLYTPSWEKIPLRKAERKHTRAKKEHLKTAKAPYTGTMSMRDVDILISREDDPSIREYQKKAMTEKRWTDAMFRIGIGPSGKSVDSVTDYRMPKIANIQKKKDINPNLIQAAVVKKIDKFNQAHRIPTNPSHFKGEMPDAKRLLGDKYDPDKEYHWRKGGHRMLSILDVTEEQAVDQLNKEGSYLKEFTYKDPYYGEINLPERLEVREGNKKAMIHEQLHRFIKKDPSGEQFRDLDGDHELFVRTYTHLLRGGRLDDPELISDLTGAEGNYENVNVNRFLRDVPHKIKTFERAVLGADYGEPSQRVTPIEEIVVTGYRDAIDNQMEQLLSSNKREVRAIRNNNPFNLKYTEIKWDGKLPLDKETEDTFERFDSNLMGMRAGVINTLTHHIKYGDDTIEKLITRHAPSNENDTKNFINFVSKNMGIEPNQKIDLKNKEVLYEYAKAVVTMEGFKSDELDSIIYDAIELGYKQKKINNLTD